MTPRKVVFLTAPLGLGGSEQQLFHLLSGLDRREFSPLVIQLGGDLLEHWVAPIRNMEIDVLRLDRSEGRGVRNWRLARILRDQSADIVHSWPRFANPYAAFAGGLARVPVRIGSIRNDPTGLSGAAATRWVTSGGLDVVVSNWRGALEKIPAPIARRTALRLVHNGVVLPNPPNDTELRRLKTELGFSADERIIGCIGRLDRNKNFQMVLKVLARLSQKWPSLRLVILGDGPEREALIRLAASLGVAEKVFLPGRVATAARFLPAFDVCCLTSLTEGLPNVVMEASAAGVPVVSTACGGVSEIVDHGVTGYIVPQRDHVAMATHVDQVLSRNLDTRGIGAAARLKIQENFSVPTMVASTMSMYEEALRGATAHSRRRASFATLDQREDAVRQLFSDPARYLQHNPHIDRRAEIVNTMVGCDAKGTVLDLGCGDGRISLQLSSQADQLVLVDSSIEMLHVARASISGALAKKVVLTQASIETFGPGEAFDVVLCLGVLAHVRSKEGAVAQIAALTKPGGVALVQITDADRLAGQSMLSFATLRRRVLPKQGYRPNRTGLDWLIECAKASGLTLEQSERYGFVLPGMGRLPLAWLTKWERALSARPWLKGMATDAILLFRKDATPHGAARRES